MPENIHETIQLDGVAFRHRMVTAADMRFHLVEGGSGETVVLLAGFPQSWFAWRRVMPLLAKRYHVIALDLPGQGDSDKPVDGYDTRTAGARIHALLKVLGHKRYFIGAHDIGAWIAYPYAVAYPEEVRRLVMLDANVPGITLPTTVTVGAHNWKNWHFFFHPVPDLPEILITGRERAYIEWFFQRKTANPAATFSPADLDEYERALRAPGNLRGALAYYRAVFEDMEQNQALSSVKLATPLLALGGDVGMAPQLYEAMKPLAENIRGGVIENCGHYIPEEQPAQLAARMLAFFDEESGPHGS
ncbi:alpha/beta fold hydrolase [Roseococcus pinisoli]|uniref:Alpha/beta hydrolase n=1 Tax=Roseococcus pinisoli TaxID=2835040 RepID=A0ABS5QJV8_9PROT|nr:alpha/beta hydrolase [Roseococcus pinisoli]MBS7813683.1 alpha/beta hydrolase [Roseococcus pinisoli]